jgi:hypothetical protein
VAFTLVNSRHRQRTREAIDKSAQLARILCRMENTDVFLDTTKNPYQVRFLAEYGRGIRLKLICLVRDGRAVVNSLMEKERKTPERAINGWLWCNGMIDRAARYLPAADVFRLKHEDLCKNPKAILADLCSFLGIESDVLYENADKSNRHIIGNFMRNSFNGEIRLDESWRKKLAPDLLRLFERRAGWVNRRCGYSE